MREREGGTYLLGMMVPIYNLSTQEAETGRTAINPKLL